MAGGYGGYYYGQPYGQDQDNNEQERDKQQARRYQAEPYQSRGPQQAGPIPPQYGYAAPQQYQQYQQYQSPPLQAHPTPPVQSESHGYYQQPSYFVPQPGPSQPMMGSHPPQLHPLSPDLAANLGNIFHNPTTQIGLQAFSIGQDYVNKNVHSCMFIIIL